MSIEIYLLIGLFLLTIDIVMFKKSRDAIARCVSSGEIGLIIGAAILYSVVWPLILFIIFIGLVGKLKW